MALVARPPQRRARAGQLGLDVSPPSASKGGDLGLEPIGVAGRLIARVAAAGIARCDTIPRGLAFGMDGLWLAAEGWVYRINSHSHEVTATQMPEGVTATGVAIDEETGTIWISTCAVDCDDPI